MNFSWLPTRYAHRVIALFLTVACSLLIFAIGWTKYSSPRQKPPPATRLDLETDSSDNAGAPPHDLLRQRFGGTTLAATNQNRAISTNATAGDGYFSNWQSLGPSNVVDAGTGYAYEPSLGRVNCIAADPTNPNKLFAGAATGGIWASADGGQTWASRTDNLPLISVSSIAIDPQNPSVMYLATGDADGGATPSVGVYKSTDGGLSWSATGLVFAMTDYYQIYRLTVHPSLPGKVFAATNNGIYITADSGATWQQIHPQGQSNASYISWYDVKFQPNNPSIVYTIGSGAQFYRSTDGGATWQQTTVGLPDASATTRSSMAVTIAEPQAVYLLCANNSDALNGIYRSSDGGASFAQLTGGGSLAGGFGQQAWYTNCLAASATNPGELYAGGLTICRSADDGATWSTVRGTETPYYAGKTITHVDVHDLEFFGGFLYSCTDGGLHRTADGGANWTVSQRIARHRPALWG